MYHLTRNKNHFARPLCSAALEETAKKMIEHYESDPPEWRQQKDGTWKAAHSEYLFYTVGADYTDYGKLFAGRK